MYIQKGAWEASGAVLATMYQEHQVVLTQASQHQNK